MSKETQLTYIMRKSTRTIHSISDALVNTKLALAMWNDQVWTEGLLIFYEVFKFIETAIAETTNSNLKKVDFPEIYRTEAFEKDLTYYLGSGWKKDYVPRTSVRRYLNYLGKLKRNEPELLIAYVYHLYMGLLSGGQILRKKRNLINKVTSSDNLDGNYVTHFEGNITEIKKRLRSTINELSNDLTDDMRSKIINEGNMVFKLNNEIIGTISYTNEVYQKYIMYIIIIVLAYYLYNYIF